MDRNQFIGLILMLVLITVYFQFFAPEPEAPPVEIDNVTTSDPAVENQTETEINNTPQFELNDSTSNALNTMKYGTFGLFASGEEKNISIENDKLIITFNEKGGKIDQVQLKEYDTDDNEILTLVNDKHKIVLFFEHASKRININELYFNSKVENFQDSTIVTFSISNGGASLSQVYTLRNGSYELGYKIVNGGLASIIDPKDLTYEWNAALLKIESDLKDARNRTSVIYRTKSGSVEELSRTSQDRKEDNIEEGVNWVSFNQKFFSSAIIAKNGFTSGFVTQDVPADTSVVKQTSMLLNIAYTDIANNKAEFSYFFGPNDYNVLKNVAEGFDDNQNLGWFFLPFINKYLIIPIFNFPEMFLGNYGLIIIIMVLIIRLMLSPLTYRSHISMAKMRVLKPEIDEIKERVGDDMTKVQQEQMQLYRQVGINPLSGCIPVLLQFPILVSLFYFIPSAIQLRHESFLWAKDLSTYDSVLNLPFTIPFYGDHVSLFTLLMAISTVLFTMANSQMTTVQGPMKTVQYIMPVMLLFFFNSYPSGLSYYYFVSNIVSYGQIILFRKFINEDKIKAILEDNKKKNKNKKKSKFQMRLEEAMKASQEAQKNRI
jgi:YidC/Oxa1 family membrane protein insertase